MVKIKRVCSIRSQNLLEKIYIDHFMPITPLLQSTLYIGSLSPFFLFLSMETHLVSEVSYSDCAYPDQGEKPLFYELPLAIEEKAVTTSYLKAHLGYWSWISIVMKHKTYCTPQHFLTPPSDNVKHQTHWVKSFTTSSCLFVKCKNSL